MNRTWMILCAFTLVIFSNGCTIIAPSYTPDYSALDAFKRQNISKIAVESVEPKNSNERVNKITLRGTTLVSPSGNYAQYLEDAIKSDLTDANLLDPSALFRLSVFLLKNDINVVGFSIGHGTIEARFSINQNGTTIFNKTISAETEFKSSFAGAVAIPKGQNEYPNLVRALLKKLYTDKEFTNALQY